MEYSVSFPTGTVQYCFTGIKELLKRAPADSSVIITDSNVATLYQQVIAAYRTIIIPAGEEHKTQQTIQSVTEQLLEFKAHKKTTIIGLGGGMITDIAGYAASIYMRGVPFGFVPTTLLAMVDAAIGGKNGVNFGLHKNMLGTIRQPSFILYDTALLHTLPDMEWSNGFAEIIKYACIFDAPLFAELSTHIINYYKEDATALNELIQRCANWKNKTVSEDETENNVRKLLNFGHTAGHAIETLYNLPHGQAVSLGMLVACSISESECGLHPDVRRQLAMVLQQYKLPASLKLHTEQLMDILVMDKKRSNNTIDYIVLSSIGSALIKPLPFETIKQALDKFSDAGNY
ncbi:3-dehydroquinate synthase [Chitinophagaceae bacterium IBVUCB1]|nr:3-dehydroquinate synthase [Chitinophagaceae bacterium IBVUCB1]